MIWLTASLTLLGRPAWAHDGPPYPILVDRPIAGSSLSIWADPDVGVGTFYFYLTEESSERPVNRRIDVAVRPLDGHLPEAVQGSERALERDPFQRIAEIQFDRRGPWKARFTVFGPDGNEAVELDVDVTPPGAGRIDLLWFLSPFLAVAFLWVKVVLKTHEYARLESSCASESSP